MGPRSKLSWNSGVFTQHDATKLQAFENGRGLKADSVAVFSSRSSTSDGLNAWWLDGARPVINNGGLLLLALPLWNEDQNVNSDTTSFWDGIASILNKENLASKTIIRLGWEMNLPSWRHAVTTGNRATWVSKFAAASARLKAKAPGVRIAFNPNEGNDQTGVSMSQLATTLKDSFDFVGPDYYNWYPVINDENAWNSTYRRSGGLKQWEDFARTNRKGYIVPEWGGYPGSSAGKGSDGAFYAKKMIERFNALSQEGITVVEAYFNEADSYIANSLWSPQQMPALANAYKNALNSTSQNTVPPVVTPSVKVESKLDASLSTSDTSVTVTWKTTVGNDGVTGVKVGRKGTDSTGYGEYFEDRELSGSIIFDKLVSGQEYPIVVQLLPTSLNKIQNLSAKPGVVVAPVNDFKQQIKEVSDRLIVLTQAMAQLQSDLDVLSKQINK